MQVARRRGAESAVYDCLVWRLPSMQRGAMSASASRVGPRPRAVHADCHGTGYTAWPSRVAVVVVYQPDHAVTRHLSPLPSPADTCLLVRDSHNHVTCNTDQVRGQMSGGRCPRGLSVLNSCLSPSSALQTTVSVEVSRRQMVDARRSRATLHCCRLLIEILMRLLSVRCVLIAQSWPARTRRA